MPRHHGGGGSRAGFSSGGGGGKEQLREVKISKAASYVLRHGATKEGLKLDERGFVNVGDLLKWPRLASLHVTFPEILSMVQTNEKQRFALIPVSTPPPPSDMSEPFPDPLNPAHHLIRATQGHSLPIANANLLTPVLVSDPDCPALAVHGTYEARWEQILKSGGLRPMGRQHVHFAPGVSSLPTAESALLAPTPTHDKTVHPPPPEPESSTDFDAPAVSTPGEQPPKVISGMRKDATVLVWVDVRRSLQEAGLKWWRSANGVLLTEGDEEGKVGLEWIVKAEKRIDGEVIWWGKEPT